MQEFSKYRVITVGFILMFIFIIAAIYTNTKDAAEQKLKAEGKNINKEVISNFGTRTKVDENSQNSADVDANEQINDTDNEINNKILLLTDRISSLEKKVYTSDNASDASAVRCSVKGIVDGDNIVYMSDEEAIKESRENNKEVIITCLFK